MALAILRKYESSLIDTEDIAGVYAVLAEATPAMWDPDELMEMMLGTAALDVHGTRLKHMREEREARRRAQLLGVQASLGNDF